MRDFLLEILACFVREYLSAAIPWLTFQAFDRRCETETTALCIAIRERARLFSPRSEQCPLFGPVGRQMSRQAHQFLGAELWRMLAVDDRSGDVRREPTKS